jgi:hypothetical protein
MLLCLMVLDLKVPNFALPEPNTNLNSAGGVAGNTPTVGTKLVPKSGLNAANSFSRTVVVVLPLTVRKALTGKICVIL